MKRFLAFAALLPSLPALAATQEELANAPVQTADPVVVWVFIIGFVVALVAGAIWYLRGDDKKQK
jgi:hypothetical protein